MERRSEICILICTVNSGRLLIIPADSAPSKERRPGYLYVEVQTGPTWAGSVSASCADCFCLFKDFTLNVLVSPIRKDNSCW